MKVPQFTIDLIEELKRVYPDRYDIDKVSVGTPDYWKYAGVIELIRTLEQHTTIKSFKEV